MSYKQNPLQQRSPKTGAGIPEAFKSPATQQKTYQQKLDASLASIKTNDAAYENRMKENRQGNVLDSLNTVKTKGRRAAAEKYGNKSRKSDSNPSGALPTNASEKTYITKKHAKKSALQQKGKSNTKTYKEKLKESLDSIKTNDAAYEKRKKEDRQSSVLDSLNTVKTKGRKAAAEKYGNKARKKKTGVEGLPTSASEKTYKTKKYIADSKK
tara:strand:+ start:120 stop:755 length:636 start_codon:yes stop_codon:yes gene_type:complete